MKCDVKIAITGRPRSGKTTLMMKIYERVKEMGFHCGGVLTPEIREGDKRVGFYVFGIRTQIRKILAIKENGRYKVFPENFRDVLWKELSEFQPSSNSIFFIDEVGKMELQGGSDFLNINFNNVVMTFGKDFIHIAHQRNFKVIDLDKERFPYEKVIEWITGTEAFLIDLDGVIIDSAEFHKDSWIFAMRKRGINFTEEDFRKTFGMRNEEILKKYFSDEKVIVDVAKDKERIYRELARGKIKLIPGVLEFLSFVKSRYKTVLVTSTPRENVEFIFEEFHLQNFFDDVVSGEEVEKGKPEPDCYVLGAKKAGAKPYMCWVVEDTSHGIIAGKKAGCKTILITKEAKKNNDRNAKNDRNDIKNDISETFADIFGTFREALEILNLLIRF